MSGCQAWCELATLEDHRDYDGHHHRVLPPTDDLTAGLDQASEAGEEPTLLIVAPPAGNALAELTLGGQQQLGLQLVRSRTNLYVDVP